MKEEPFYLNNDEMKRIQDPDQWLEQILRTDNIPPLAASFAGKVAHKAARRMMVRQHLSEFLAYAAAIFVPLLIFFGIFYFTSRESWSTWTAWMFMGRDLLAGGGGVLIFVLFADKVLLPWLFFSRHSESKRTLP